MPQIYLTGQNEIWETAAAEQAFPFLKEKKHVISLVGGGGKTTLMYFLARYFCRAGQRVLVSTTTHIQRPPEKLFAARKDQVLCLWEQGEIAVIGQPEKNKLAMPQEPFLRECMAMADTVLLEADGSKRLPCKIPRETEPVILDECDTVIGVMGMSAAGQTWEKGCFRYELARNLFPVTNAGTITAAHMAAILASERGTRRLVGQRDYYIVLNQCDSAARLRTAAEIADTLSDCTSGQPVKRIVMTAFPEEEREDIYG